MSELRKNFLSSKSEIALEDTISSDTSLDLKDGSKRNSSTIRASMNSQETGTNIPKQSSMISRKSSVRKVRFSTNDAEKTAVDENKRATAFRESSSQLGSRFSRFSRLFGSVSINKPRRSSIARPVLRYKPTYQLESKKPFETLVVQDLMKKIVDDRMDAEGKIEWESEACITLIRSLSDEILQEVKAKEYDRYKIVVTVTLGQKAHQSFHQSVGFHWSPETDALAKYVYDRANLFVIATVVGVYYD